MSNDIARLDVLVTFYNQEKYVDRALESIFSQQCDFNFNVLVGDDGSTDSTLDKVAEWSKKFPGRIVVYSMDREIGKKYIGGFRASQNRLNLLKYVTSEYFIFLDGDDYYTDIDKFQTQIDVLDNPINEDCIACAHDIWAVYPDGKRELYEKTTLKQGKVSLEKYWYRDYFHTDSIMIRSDVIPKIHSELLTYNFNDNMITYDIFQQGKMYYLKKTMAAYDQNGEGIWTGEKQLINNLRNMFLYDLCLIINPRLQLQNKTRFYATWKWFYENRKSIDKDSVEILCKEAEKRNLVYSLLWLNFEDNKNKLIWEYYKTASVAMYNRNINRVKKILTFIARSIKKIKNKLLKLINDQSFQKLYKKNSAYKEEIKRVDEKLLEKCSSYKNELQVSVAPVFENKDGIITIISDDGDYETSKKLSDLSKKYGIPMTVAGNIRNIAAHTNYWKKLIKGGNIELVNHSYNHYRMDDGWKYASNKDKFIHEIVHAELFFENQFGIKDKVFVCPENAINDLGYKVLIDDGMVAVRRGERGVNSLSPSEGTNPGNWLNLKCYGIMDSPKLLSTRRDMRQNWLEKAKGHWLIEMWHNVDVVGYQTITSKAAENHLKELKDFAQSNNLWIAKFTDVVKYLKGKENARIFSWRKENKYYIALICNTEGLEFNQKITINYTIEGTRFTYDILPNKLYCINDGEIMTSQL